MSNIPFQLINWGEIEKVKHSGEQKNAYWQSVQFPGLRIRIVNYEAGYLADHWCEKGHLVHCLKGSFITEMKSGEKYTLSEGQSYIVSDELSSHRSFSESGVELLIVDGDFLKLN